MDVSIGDRGGAQADVNQLAPAADPAQQQNQPWRRRAKQRHIFRQPLPQAEHLPPAAASDAVSNIDNSW